MTHEEIIKSWFAIAQADDVEFTSLHSRVFRNEKQHLADIEVEPTIRFVNCSEDIYRAMEASINQYSEFITKNEKKQ